MWDSIDLSLISVNVFLLISSIYYKGWFKLFIVNEYFKMVSNIEFVDR